MTERNSPYKSFAGGMWDWCGGRRLQCHLFNEFAGIFDAKTREASAPAGGTKSHIDPAESPTRARLPYSDGGDCFLGSNKLQALLPPAAAAVYYCQTLAMADMVVWRIFTHEQ